MKSIKKLLMLSIAMTTHGSLLLANEAYADDSKGQQAPATAIKPHLAQEQMMPQSIPLAAITKGVPVKLFISPNVALSASVLDIWWAQREDVNNQEMIAKYLQTMPKVPNNFETAWKTARLVYFIGNYGYGREKFVSSKAGAELFHYGADAGKIAMQQRPDKVEGYYWYAIDLGSYGLAKGILSAAANAKDGMRALEKAQAIDPSYHWYGSSRILGRYYQELPGLFGGDKKKALELMTTAVNKSPEFSNNSVFLGNYYLSQDKYSAAKEACSSALAKRAVDGKYEEMRYIDEAHKCVATASAKLAK